MKLAFHFHFIMIYLLIVMDIDTLSIQILNQSFFYWSNVVENEKYPYLDESPFNQKVKYFFN